MTKQDAMRAIIENGTPEVDQIYILEETADTSARVVTSVKGHLTKGVYDFIAKALTGSIYLFKVAKVDQYKYKDWDYNVIRTYTRSIDGELRRMDD